MKKVENFRLTKEQKEWMREIQKVNRIKEILTNGALREWHQQGSQLQKMFVELEQRKQMLQQVAPEEKMEEIPGQEKALEELTGEEQAMASEEEQPTASGVVH